MPKDKVYIIGLAPDGISSLSSEAHRLIEQAEIVFGGSRLLAMFPSLAGEKIAIRNNLAEITDLIEKNMGRRRIVILASGDPDFYGIAGHLTGKLGKDNLEIIPNVSAMQLAFARIKESWEDAALVSVHGRPIGDIIGMVRSHDKVGIFTDDKRTPSAIARVLLKHGIDNYTVYVCQDLGGRNEKIVETDLYRLRQKRFSPLNVLILIKSSPEKTDNVTKRRLLGTPDEEFFQRRPKEGLITKQEVRAISIAKLQLTDESVLWDIGAGSGAVSIEASSLIRRGRVYAIEKNDSDIAIIKKNIKKFRPNNIEVVHAFAPDGLSEIPYPTEVFIGGSGGRIDEIVDFVSRRLKPNGHVVMNIVALENLDTALRSLKAHGFMLDVTMVNVARRVNIAELSRLQALNPVFIVDGVLVHEGE